MIKLRNYDNWKEWEGASEGSGRSEKIWLCNEKGEKGIFKFPKTVDRKTLLPNSTEFISEHLAYLIAEKLNLKSAQIEIGYRDGRIGCMSKSFLKENQVLEHGVEFITLTYPNFDIDKLFDPETKTFYSYDMIYNSMNNVYKDTNVMETFIYQFVRMMIFDMLIGNTDRHQQNWGIVKNSENEFVSMSPLYDNGSSLCAYVPNRAIKSYLGNDEQRLKSLTDSKSTSRIRIDKDIKKEPKHSEVVKFLCEKYKEISLEFAVQIENSITRDWVDKVLEEYPSNILTDEKKKLISIFICEKIELLKKIFKM